MTRVLDLPGRGNLILPDGDAVYWPDLCGEKGVEFPIPGRGRDHIPQPSHLTRVAGTMNFETMLYENDGDLIRLTLNRPKR